ncbi:IclR family transcriptional regulator [Leifsonia kafniensis]|uniref:IclR family transcriptional regulator n=2 Tax=Leifsonia kafniensis TaxID=475957 RepID=A0ABP7KYS7_9MICO
MRVLSAFDIDSPFLTLSQVAQRTGTPVTTTQRILVELAQHGLVERRADKKYRLGVRLWELACRTPGALGLRETAMPYMQELHARVRQHTQLGVLDGHEVLFLERLSTRDAVVNLTIIGGRHPLYASSSGLLLLAQSSEDLVEDVIERGLTCFTANSISSGDQLRRVLAEVRESGHVVASGLIHPQARGLAVAVTGVDGLVVAALSVVVSNDEVDPGRHLVMLRQTAQGISASLRAAYLPPRDPRARAGGRYRSMVNSSQQSMEYMGHAKPLT